MVIDDHVHVHEWSFREGDAEYEVDYVVGLMDKWKIDKSIIMDSLAYIGLDQNTSNDHTRDAVDAYPDRLIGFANIKPPQGFAACRDEMKRTIEDWGFRGIKLHPQVDRYPANHRELVHPIIELAMRYDIPVWFHTGHAPNATPTLVGSLARTFPEAKIVMGHMGSGMFYDAICAGDAATRTSTSTSRCRVGTALSRHVARSERTGSCSAADSPYANPGAMKRMIEESPLSPADKAMILGENMARLLNLNVAAEARA